MLVFLLASVLVALATAEEDCDCRAQWGPIIHRAHGQEARLNRIGQRLDELQKKLDAGSDSIAGYKDYFAVLDGRIHELQGE